MGTMILRANGITPRVTGLDLRGVVIRLEDGEDVTVWLNYHPEPMCERVFVYGRPVELDLPPHQVVVIRQGTDRGGDSR